MNNNEIVNKLTEIKNLLNIEGSLDSNDTNSNVEYAWYVGAWGK